LAKPDNESVVYSGDWPQIAIVDPKQHPKYSPATYHIKAAPLTGYLDEGDVIDLGDAAYQVLHLPGHSPGSIGLLDVKAKVLFSGDALYDGALLDSLYHSEPAVYLQTLDRIASLDVSVFHGGHEPSFGAARMREIIADYKQGNNAIGDIKQWYEDSQASLDDIFSDQDWSGAVTC